MIVGPEKTIGKVTSSFVDEIQSNSKSRCHQNETTKPRVISAWRLLHPRIQMNEAIEESVIIVPLLMQGSTAVFGLATVGSSFVSLKLDPVHHELTNLMLKLMLCNTRQQKEVLKESRQRTGDERSFRSLASALRYFHRAKDLAKERKKRCFSSDNAAAVWKEQGSVKR